MSIFVTCQSNRTVAILNSSVSVFYQIVIGFLSIVSRCYFLQYFGVELLGLTSTFASVIAISSLAETGLGSCVIYRLYYELQQKNFNAVNELINVARFFLSSIGALLICFSLVFSQFLGFITTDVTINLDYIIYFLLQVLSVALSYFISYKRLLLIADRLDYIGKLFDSISYIVFSILKIIVCVYLQDLFLFLLVSCVQVVVSNIVLNFFCNKLYPFLKYEKANKELLYKMLPDMKNLFFGGVSAYLFSCSDNIILSTVVSTVVVGYLANYTAITSTLKSFVLNLMLFMGPIIGNQIASKNRDYKKINNYFQFYDFSLFLFACIILVPEFVLIQDFIKNVWGSKYLLEFSLVTLIILDQYITIVQDSNGVFLSVTGKFRELKVSDFWASISNIIISIVLAILYGLSGVLIGTVIARVIQWVLKAKYARNTDYFTYCNKYVIYFFRTVFKGIIFCICYISVNYIYAHIIIENFILRFIFGGIVGIVLSSLIVFLLSLFTNDSQIFFKIINRKNI